MSEAGTVYLLNLKKETAVKGVNRGKYPSLHLGTLDVEITELCHFSRCSISCDLGSNRNISAVVVDCLCGDMQHFSLGLTL